MVGVSAASLRMWERYNLVNPKRTPSGYRIYTMNDIERLREIRRLLDGGANAAAISMMLEPERSNGHPGRIHAPERGTGPGGVGDRIRDLRKRSGLTLRQVADLTGMSTSYINSIERSLSSPSTASLQKLAAAFSTNVPALLGSENALNDRLVVRQDERATLDVGIDGVVIEDLSTAESNLEPLIFNIAPGAGSDGSYSHEGEEFLFVLRGKLRINLGGVEEYDLSTGDSMTFSSVRPHHWVNPGRTRAIIVWVNTPRTF